MISDRILDSNKKYSEEDDELKLRPSTLNEYIGQEDMKKNPEKYREMERKKKFMSLDGFYSKLKGWDVLLRLVLCAGLAVGAYFSVNYSTSFKDNNPGCTVVEATVIHQIDQTTIEVEEENIYTTPDNETFHNSHIGNMLHRHSCIAECRVARIRPGTRR